jgi:hypothetical protein
MVNALTLMVPNMLESIKRGRGVDMVNTHSPLVPNILDSGKRINCGVRGPSLIRMEMCTAVSGRMVSLHCIKSHFQKYFSEANSVFKTHGHTFIDISTRKA